MADQSGSAKSALNIIDYNLDIYYIREGEIKNYIYDPGTGVFSGSATSGQWIPQTSIISFSGEITFVATSGMELWCDISGDTVQLYSYASDSTTKLYVQTRVANMSGTEPIIFSYAADSTTKIAAQMRVSTLSGTDPIVFSYAADSTTKIDAHVRVTNLSGTEPVYVREFTDVSTYIVAGSGAIAGYHYLAQTLTRLENVTVHLTSAPTISSEMYLVVTPALGSGVAAYATKHLSENPYITASQNYVYIPDQPLPLQSGDTVNLMYSNPCGSSGLGYSFRMAFKQERA